MVCARPKHFKLRCRSSDGCHTNMSDANKLTQNAPVCIVTDFGKTKGYWFLHHVLQSSFFSVFSKMKRVRNITKALKQMRWCCVGFRVFPELLGWYTLGYCFPGSSACCNNISEDAALGTFQPYVCTLLRLMPSSPGSSACCNNIPQVVVFCIHHPATMIFPS